jgi:hypothetical protein
LSHSQQRIPRGLYGLDLFEKKFKPIELTGDERFKPAITASDLDRSLGLSYQGLNPLHDLSIAKDTLRLEQVQHLRPQFVDRSVRGGKLSQARSKFERLLKIVWTIPLCLGNCIVGDGSQCPRSLD